MSAARVLLLARTLPTLRGSQVAGRLWRRLHRVRPDTSTAPPVRPLAAGAPLVPGARRAPSLVGPTRVELLARQAEIADARAWNDPRASRLWLYHLHQHDDLNARGAEQRADWHRALLARWIDENPPGAGVGWEPHPTSRRIVNWIQWGDAGHALDARAVHSLAVQTRALRAGLETHLLGNHLLDNAVALCFAGAFFEGDEARGWLATGLELLARELPEQVLADGGHFERSPMYHALVLERVLDLLALARRRPDAFGAEVEGLRGAWSAVARRMRHWLACLVHPDGELAFFNDVALGVAPCRSELEAYARRLGLGAAREPREGLELLADSGYARLTRGDAVAIADVGEVGPRYLPGHAHADTLSFELSLGARRLVVNSGTSVYARGRERERQRSTAAHSTVLVDGEDSSEVWASFRVARRAHPFDLEVDETRGRLRLACSHDGYRRLAGRPVHRRTWTLDADGLSVDDRITGRFRRAESRTFWHPDVELALVEGPAGAAGSAAAPGLTPVPFRAGGGRAHLAAATWHPSFHLSRPSTCLRVDLDGPRGLLELRLPRAGRR